MKYLITENRLESFITSVFDKDLTPVGGWWSHSKIKRELRGFEEAFPIYYDKDFYTDLADNDSPKFMNYLKKYILIVNLIDIPQDLIFLRFQVTHNPNHP